MGAMQFPLDQPLPRDVIRRIVEFRAEENRAKAAKQPAMSESAARMWSAFVASGLPDAPDADTPYTAWHFGTAGAMPDELAGLVVAGRKRATAGALWSYEHEGEALPASATTA